jgi:hypothetical protein
VPFSLVPKGLSVILKAALLFSAALSSFIVFMLFAFGTVFFGMYSPL